MTSSPAFNLQIRKPPPERARYHPLTSIHAYDEAVPGIRTKDAGRPSRIFASRTSATAIPLIERTNYWPTVRTLGGRAQARAPAIWVRTPRISGSGRGAGATARHALHIRQGSPRKILATRSAQQSWQSVHLSPTASSFPSCDDIMILGAKRTIIQRIYCAGRCQQNDQSQIRRTHPLLHEKHQSKNFQKIEINR